MIFYYLLVSVMPLTQHPFWTAYVGEFTVIKYLGAVCLLYAIFYLFIRKSVPRFFQTGQSRWFLLLFVIGCASGLAKDKTFTWETSAVVIYISFLILGFVTITVVDSLARLRWVLLVAIGSVAWASLYVIREWQKFHAIYAGFRPGWVVGDPDYFSVSCVICLPIAFYYMIETRRTWERLFCLGCLLTTLLALMFAASRGGFIGLTASLLYVVWRTRKRVRNLVLVFVFILPLSLILPISPVSRFAHPTSSDQEAAQERLAVWHAGIQMVKAHPFAGVGLGRFKTFSQQYGAGEPHFVPHIAHNSYLEIAAEMGIPALFVFLAISFCTFKRLGKIGEFGSTAGIPLLFQTAVGIRAGLIAYWIAAFFISVEYQKIFWLMVFLSMSMESICVHIRIQRQKGLVQEVPGSSNAEAIEVEMASSAIE